MIGPFSTRAETKRESLEAEKRVDDLRLLGTTGLDGPKKIYSR